MPNNYTDYAPDQLLSQNQVAALAEVQKIVEARILYNYNLLTFLLNKENEAESNTLIKHFYFTESQNCSPKIFAKLKTEFIQAIAHDHRYYTTYLEKIKNCKTIENFDNLYFHFFVESEGYSHKKKSLYNEMHLLSKKTSEPAETKKQIITNYENCSKERDLCESIYYQEVCNILEAHVSERSCQFKRYHRFTYSIEGEEQIIRIRPTHAAKKILQKDVPTLKERLKTESPESAINGIYKTFEDYDKQCKLRASAESDHYNSAKAFESSFLHYGTMRKHFDLWMNFAYKAHEFLNPPAPVVLSVENTVALLNSKNDVDVKPKQIAKELTVTPPVVRVLAAPALEQKNDTPVMLIEFSKIHPTIQLISNLKPKEAQMLLDWIKKPPHLSVPVTELERIVKKLNGKIDPSSGGSHHRITFKSCLAFVDALEQDPSATTKEKTVHGPAVKPHGKEKSSPCLPSYSIDTFIQTLKKIGITKTVLEIYRQAHCGFEVRPQPALCLTNAHITFTKSVEEAHTKELVKMLLFSGAYNPKNNMSNLQKLVRLETPQEGAKKRKRFPASQQYLVKNIFAFLYKGIR